MNRIFRRYAPRIGAVAMALWLGGCEIGTEAPPAGTAAPAAAGGAGGPTSSRAARGQLRFVDGYERGYALAVSQSKPMLVFFTAEWCHFCHQMADEAFTHPQVVRLADQFVCILVDADLEPAVCQQHQVTGYPTIQFLSPRGVPLERIVGKKPGHQVMMAMQAALQHVARNEAGRARSVIR
jgi:thiol-disulfide isomerase/thioredoxin